MILIITSSLKEDDEVVQPEQNPGHVFEQLVTELRSKSERARGLLLAIENSPKTVGVFLNSRMTSEYYPPTVALMDYFGAPDTCTGGFVVCDLTRRITARSGKGKASQSQVLPIEISLAHELGHAEQYLTRENWFMDLFARSTNSSLGDNERREAKLAIEQNNLETTEWPICDNYGALRRERYD